MNWRLMVGGVMVKRRWSSRDKEMKTLTLRVRKRGKPLFEKKLLRGKPPVIVEFVERETPVLDKIVEGETPVLEKIAEGETPVLEMMAEGETPMETGDKTPKDFRGATPEPMEEGATPSDRSSLY